jgi:hypothetical protein
MKPVVPKALIAEAMQADRLFRESWEGIKVNTRLFGKACHWIESKGLHKYIKKPGSKKGYMTFDDYVKLQTGGSCSRTFIFDAVRIYKLSLGENAVEAEVIDKMSKKNQLELAKLPPAKRTKKVVEAAATQTVNEFAVTAQAMRNEDLSAEKQKIPSVYWRHKMHPRSAQALDDTIADFSLLKGVVLDGDTDEGIFSKAVLAMTAAARSWAAEDIKHAKEALRRGSPELAEAQPDSYTASDARERIATVVAERRIVNRNPRSIAN